MICSHGADTASSVPSTDVGLLTSRRTELKKRSRRRPSGRQVTAVAGPRNQQIRTETGLSPCNSGPFCFARYPLENRLTNTILGHGATRSAGTQAGRVVWPLYFG